MEKGREQFSGAAAVIQLSLLGRRERLHVLCLGAHSDDVEIGCGGTILSLSHSDLEVTWVVFSAKGEREDEARRSADAFLAGAGKTSVEVHEFPDGFFPHEGAAIKEQFEDLKRRCAPDLILTHRGVDRHQDHRTLSELTWNTFRDHFILEYEIPKYDGDLGTPNVFFPLEDDVRRRKVDLLMDLFSTQRSKRWFSPETFNGLMRLRGVECAAPTGWAEGFDARKVLLGA